MLAGMGSRWQSSRSFVRAVVGRWWLLIPGFVGGADWVFGLVHRWFPAYEPPVTGDIGVVLLLSGGLVVASFFAFHDLRVEKDELARRLDEREARKAALAELGQAIASGNQLRADLFESTPEMDESNRMATEWANGAAAIIETRWPERKDAFYSHRQTSLGAYTGKPLWFTNHINWLDARIAWLTEMQREIAVPPLQSTSHAISSQDQT